MGSTHDTMCFKCFYLCVLLLDAFNYKLLANGVKTVVASQLHVILRMVVAVTTGALEILTVYS